LLRKVSVSSEISARVFSSASLLLGERQELRRKLARRVAVERYNGRAPNAKKDRK